MIITKSVLMLLAIFTWNQPKFLEAANSTKESVEGLKYIHDILDSKHYDPHVRPFLNNGTVNVTLQLSIIALGPVNDKDFTFRVDYFIRQWWIDDRLRFPGDGKVTFTGNPKDRFWLPDLYVINSREVKKHSLVDTFRTTVHADGTIYWSTRISEICSCKMHLENFPMDKQNCDMVFESYAYNTGQMRMRWHQKLPIEVSRGHLSVEGYEVEDVTTEKDQLAYSYNEEAPFDHLVVTFQLYRALSTYISRIYIPSIFLVVMTWGTFWLPPSTYPARVAVIVTNFLASVFILRSGSRYNNVPYLTALEIFFVINVTFILLCMFEYMITIHLNRLKELKLKRKLRFNKKEDIEMKAPRNAEQREPLTNGVETKPKEKDIKAGDKTPITDRISRFVFPVSYAFFMIVYFAYFLSQYD